MGLEPGTRGKQGTGPAQQRTGGNHEGCCSKGSEKAAKANKAAVQPGSEQGSGGGGSLSACGRKGCSSKDSEKGDEGEHAAARTAAAAQPQLRSSGSRASGTRGSPSARSPCCRRG
jgi:hypothetical protein